MKLSHNGPAVTCAPCRPTREKKAERKALREGAGAVRDQADEFVGRKRVARLMRRAGLKGVHKRRFLSTTRSGPVPGGR
jgi:hypothetical protein